LKCEYDSEFGSICAAFFKWSSVMEENQDLYDEMIEVVCYNIYHGYCDSDGKLKNAIDVNVEKFCLHCSIDERKEMKVEVYEIISHAFSSEGVEYN
jgi:hypothetical protein